MTEEPVRSIVADVWGTAERLAPTYAQRCLAAERRRYELRKALRGGPEPMNAAFVAHCEHVFVETYDAELKRILAEEVLP